MSYDDLSALQGKVVTEVWFAESHMTFVCRDGAHLTWVAEGDCCSITYLTDFIGLDKLIGNPVVSTRPLDLLPEDIKLLEKHRHPRDDHDSDVKYYGHEIVIDHPKWGEMTVVVSFRNASNGYYGGSLTGPLSEGTYPDSHQVRLTTDIVTG